MVSYTPGGKGSPDELIDEFEAIYDTKERYGEVLKDINLPADNIISAKYKYYHPDTEPDEDGNLKLSEGDVNLLVFEPDSSEGFITRARVTKTEDGEQLTVELSYDPTRPPKTVEVNAYAIDKVYDTSKELEYEGDVYGFDPNTPFEDPIRFGNPTGEGIFFGPKSIVDVVYTDDPTRLEGGPASDFLYGGDGNDTLNGGLGPDYMAGGKGDDIYYVDNPKDFVHEPDVEDGHDTVYASVDFSLSYKFESETQEVVDASEGLDDLILQGSAAKGGGNDRNNKIYGNSKDNTLSGGAGDDYLDGWEGNDTLYGGDQEQTAETGNDVLVAWTGNDLLYGGDGDDWLDGASDNDTLHGGDGNDTLGNSVVPESGDDQMYGENGNDQLYGGDGKDSLNGGGISIGEHDTLTGGTGADKFILGTSERAFYIGDGEEGYATIVDFHKNSQGDKILVHGVKDSYRLDASRNFFSDSTLDTAIYYNNDLIGVVADKVYTSRSALLSFV